MSNKSIISKYNISLGFIMFSLNTVHVRLIMFPKFNDDIKLWWTR